MKATKPNNPQKHVTITTDGGCDPNPGRGAWAAILRYGNACRTLSGFDLGMTTSNRMELTAVAESLEALKEPCKVKLRTDSMQCIYAVTVGYMGATTKRRMKWERTGTNMDIVRRIWTQLERHRVTPVWVKGHSGDHDNEACDKIATQVIRERWGNQQPLDTAQHVDLTSH
jgi:ribonuclease HI